MLNYYIPKIARKDLWDYDNLLSLFSHLDKERQLYGDSNIAKQFGSVRSRFSSKQNRIFGKSSVKNHRFVRHLWIIQNRKFWVEKVNNLWLSRRKLLLKVDMIGRFNTSCGPQQLLDYCRDWFIYSWRIAFGLVSVNLTLVRLWQLQSIDRIKTVFVTLIILLFIGFFIMCVLGCLEINEFNIKKFTDLIFNVDQ
jgi:hypothetical protein